MTCISENVLSSRIGTGLVGFQVLLEKKQPGFWPFLQKTRLLLNSYPHLYSSHAEQMNMKIEFTYVRRSSWIENGKQAGSAVLTFWRHRLRCLNSNIEALNMRHCIFTFDKKSCQHDACEQTLYHFCQTIFQQCTSNLSYRTCLAIEQQTQDRKQTGQNTLLEQLITFRMGIKL